MCEREKDGVLFQQADRYPAFCKQIREGVGCYASLFLFLLLKSDTAHPDWTLTSQRTEILWAVWRFHASRSLHEDTTLSKWFKLTLNSPSASGKILFGPYVVVCCSTEEQWLAPTKLLEYSKAVLKRLFRNPALRPPMLTARWRSHDIFIMHVFSCEVLFRFIDLWVHYEAGLSESAKKCWHVIYILIWSNLLVSAVKSRQPQWL